MERYPSAHFTCWVWTPRSLLTGPEVSVEIGQYLLGFYIKEPHGWKGLKVI